jgi:hypothetical protein
MMDIQEQVQEAEKQDLEALGVENASRIEASIEELDCAFEKGDLNVAQFEAVKLNYWTTIAKLIDQRGF